MKPPKKPIKNSLQSGGWDYEIHVLMLVLLFCTYPTQWNCKGQEGNVNSKQKTEEQKMNYANGSDLGS